MNGAQDYRKLVDPELIDLMDQLETVDITLDTLTGYRNRAIAPLPINTSDASNAVRLSTRSVPALKGSHLVSLWIYEPPATTASLGCIFHMHGGGYVEGHPRYSEPFHRELCAELACVLVSVDYRLAPETSFPGNLEDCYTGLRWVFTNAAELKVDPQRIGVMGESAGGGLAAALALLTRDRGELSLSFQHLIYPMLDHRTGAGTDTHPHAGQAVWTAPNNQFGWSALLGPSPLLNPNTGYASPALAEDLSRLPPAYISAGAIDLFLEEDLEYARRLIRAAVPVEMHVYPGAFHAFDLHQTAHIASAARRDSRAALARALVPDGGTRKGFGQIK
jgi:triacylglycerol lipase